MNCGSTAHPQNLLLRCSMQDLDRRMNAWFFKICFLREHHLSDHRRRAAGRAAASQESEEEGENTSRSVCDRQIWWGVLCSESSSSSQFLSLYPIDSSTFQHLLDVSWGDVSCWCSLKKVDFIKERVTCLIGLYWSILWPWFWYFVDPQTSLTLSSCLRRLFQSHDGCGCRRCGRIPELLPDGTGHNEEATLLNHPSNLHPHTCSRCNNLVYLQVELLFTAEDWLLTQYNV